MNVAYYVMDDYPPTSKAVMIVKSIKTSSASQVTGKAFRLTIEDVKRLNEMAIEEEKSKNKYWSVEQYLKTINTINLYYGELEHELEITAEQVNKASITAGLNMKAIVTAERGREI